MAILRGIELTYTGKGALFERKWRKMMKGVFLRIGQAWQKTMLPRHWDRGARAKYGYQPRSPGWIRRKQAMMKRGAAAANAGNDLLFTGSMKDWVLSTAKVTATPGGAHVKAGGPDYLRINFRPPRPNMIAEISALTEEERQELTTVGDEALNELWAAEPETTQTDTSVAAFFHGGD